MGESGIGVCCSGGGIRSAAFNLGALQALDEADVLRRADYLSAVSGGSYIASAYAVAAATATRRPFTASARSPPGRPRRPGSATTARTSPTA